MIIHDLQFLKSIRDPLIIVDDHFKILYINKNGAAIYGKRHDHLVGEKCHKLFHNSSSPCISCPIEPVFVKKKTIVSEKWVTLPDGRKKCGELRAYPVFDEQDKVIAVTTIIVDITDKKTAQPDQFNNSSHIKFDLSKRETQILDLISKGYTNPDISQDLCISINTVKTHIVNIFNKIGVSDRTQAAIIALKLNLI
ncbi:MAG: LuxR C-terminal-related transcriptional regulator [Pseudomonadota bacterium]